MTRPPTDIIAQPVAPTLLRRAVPVAVLLAAALALLGLLLYPTSLGQGAGGGVLADLVMLGVYGGLALFGPFTPGRRAGFAVRLGVICGLIGGLLLTGDLLSGYLFAPSGAVSTFTSLTAYGLFALLTLMSAWVAGIRSGRFLDGLGAAFWCILVGELIWIAVEFAAFYLLAGTPNGAQFLAGEMRDDFARSGARDYAGWVMADFYGAAFFHPLLSLVLGGIVGGVGAALGWLIARARATVPAKQG